MKRILYILLFSFFLFKSALSQISVSGKLTDSENGSSLPGATVVLLNLPDSTIYKGTAADIDGNFIIDNVINGKYALRISFIGYNDNVRTIDAASDINLGKISLKQSSRTLKDVVIVDKAPTAVQKGDTTQFNASSYKTNPDANAEDLITKMSGVTSQDGKIQAQGEEVKKVLVDGKPFFGDDPNAVLKNLPADVIDKIQVFDQQSDQSKFTGINDGNTTKTLNIITKPGMKNGTFGKFYAGYGHEDVYKAGLNINFFKGDRRFSIVSQSNNINEQNFSSEDLAGVMSSSGGGGRGGRGGPGMGGPSGGPGSFGGNNSNNFLVNAKNGIATTHAIGINFSDKWNKTTELSASYFLNNSDNTAEQSINRQFLPASDSSLLYRENSINNSKNTNHRFNMKLEWKKDTNNTVTFNPKFNAQQNTGRSNLSGINTIGSDTLNNTNNIFNSKVFTYNASAELNLQHKFKKQGRTISATINGAFSPNNSSSALYSSNTFFNDSSSYVSLLDQQSSLVKAGTTYGSNITYTEPINLKSIIHISYSNSFNFTKNDKRTYNYTSIDDSYSNLDTILSNVFNSEYSSHKAGLGYRFNNSKLNMMISANYQVATLSSEQDFPYQYNLKRKFENVLPSAMIRYTFDSRRNIRIMYRTQTVQPGIDQLQNVLNNSNPTQLSIGNPDLKQNYENTFFSRYASSNTEKGTSFFAMIAGSFTNNYIANSVFTASRDTIRNGILLLRGSQLTRPVNVDGYMNLRSFLTYGLPFSLIRSNVNINANAGFTRTPGIINDKMNYSNAQTYGGGISVASNISKQIDFTLSTNLTYNSVENTINTNLNTTYFNQNSKAKLNVIFLKNVVVSTDLTHQYYQGLSQGFNQNILLWNAALGYKFMKDQKAEIRLSVNDILEQNTSITRNSTETYIEDIQSNLLQRYFMLTFSYNIKVFKKPSEEKQVKKAE